MNLNFDYVKKKLEEEFVWLSNNYPTEKFEKVNTHIYDFKDYNQNYIPEEEFLYGDSEVNAFLFHNVNGTKLELAILMVLNSNYVVSEWDKAILDKGAVREEDFFYFMLYHEYGHLVRMHEEYKRKGINGFMSLLDEMAEEIERVDINIEKELYRELWFEREADEFAYNIYELRKDKL